MFCKGLSAKLLTIRSEVESKKLVNLSAKELIEAILCIPPPHVFSDLSPLRRPRHNCGVDPFMEID
jgi:hypothetical protein